MFGNSNLNDEILRAWIESMFQKYDADNSGGLDEQQMTHLFNDLFRRLNMATTVTIEHSKQAIKSMDQNGDGTIDKKQLFDAFKLLMQRQQMQSQGWQNHYAGQYRPSWQQPNMPNQQQYMHYNQPGAPNYYGYHPNPPVQDPYYGQQSPFMNNSNQFNQQPNVKSSMHGGGWSKRKF